MIELQDIYVGYNKNNILKEISIPCVPKGKIVAVIGPNGTGKSTLFKCISGIIKPYKGRVLYDNTDIKTISIDTLAKHICYMPQHTYSNASLTVFEVVLMAKKFKSGKAVSTNDIENISRILSALGIDTLSQRYISGLSGGQSQLVSIAQTLVRNPDVLLLDEPTSALDLNHQIESLDLIRTITQKTQMTTFVSLHDLGLAGRYADYIMVLNKGSLFAYGKTKDILTSAMLESVYDVKADIIDNSQGTYVLPICAIESRLKNLDISLLS